ncbi:MAG: TetR/AcrR family transcriptional regulator [Immundisolibacteraceae bacterium]|nr:TetR/AcrR family transcriptional regulator [Immundisolibacteraceae bacterium]
MDIAKQANLTSTTTREAILESAVGLFAESGFSGVSMRDLARACGITPAALYHHFENKKSLYVESIKHAFAARAEDLEPLLDRAAQGEETVRSIISWFVGLVASDKIFRRLLHRELLEGDAERLQLITEQVLQAPFEKICRTLEKVYPKADAAFVGISTISMVLGHFELASLRGFLGVSEAGYGTDEMANRITNLMVSGFEGA